MNPATSLLLNDNFSLSLLLLIVVSYSKKYSTHSFEFFSNTPVEFGLKKLEIQVLAHPLTQYITNTLNSWGLLLLYSLYTMTEYEDSQEN